MRRTHWLWGIALVLLGGCVSVPEGIHPVEGFELQRYLGRWYEIARLDHGFERGLTQVSAHYSPRPDGGIRVINRGYDSEAAAWREAEGRAYFVERPDLGRLKVSFFGPFFGGYHVVDLDPDYQHALVMGPSRDYVWILARRPQLEPPVRQRLTQRLRSLGVATAELIWVEH